MSIYSFHHATPPCAAGNGAYLLSDDETGFDGHADATYRAEAWAWMLSGGASYIMLDYSFTAATCGAAGCGGAAVAGATPGGGSSALRASLGALNTVLNGPALPLAHAFACPALATGANGPHTLHTQSLATDGACAGAPLARGDAILTYASSVLGRGPAPNASAAVAVDVAWALGDANAGSLWSVAWLDPVSGAWSAPNNATADARGALSARSPPLFVTDAAALATCVGAGGSGPPTPPLPPPLQPLAFVPLPLGALRPEGWLRRELALQNSGLAGHLQDFYAGVANSTWLGGNDKGYSEEAFVYWLRGTVGAAHLLNDSRLLQNVGAAFDYILGHQTASGWLGPDDAPASGNQLWPRFLLTAALEQHLEGAGDARVVPALEAFLAEAARRLESAPMGYTWAGCRYPDFLSGLHWLLDYSAANYSLVSGVAAEVLRQGLSKGCDWEAWFDGPSFPKAASTHLGMEDHGVNNAGAIKSGAVRFRQTGNASSLASSWTRVARLDTWHGGPSAMFSCDEHLAGTAPSRGYELCAVVEAISSFAYLFAATGDPVFAERAEALAYNALPGAVAPDHWAHNYLSQVSLRNNTRAPQNAHPNAKT